MNAKRCKKCDVVKPLDAYYKQAAGLYGRTSRCIECTNAEHAEYRESKRSLSAKEARVRKESLRARGLKNCSDCDTIKPITDFYLAADRPMSRCKQCSDVRQKKWKAENPQHMLDYTREYMQRDDVKDRRLANRHRRVANSPRIVMQITLRHGLKRRPTENPATVDDLMAKFEAQGGKCAVSGITMTWAKGTVLPTSLSLDRIDHTQGYSADNLRLVCHAVNAFKGRMTDAEMLVMAKAIVANLEKSNEPTWVWETFREPRRVMIWPIEGAEAT